MPDPLQFPVPSSFETPRLLLRSFRVEDAPLLHAALVDSIDDLRRHPPFAVHDPAPRPASTLR